MWYFTIFTFALLILYRFSKMASLSSVLKQREITVLIISRTNLSLTPMTEKSFYCISYGDYQNVLII